MSAFETAVIDSKKLTSKPSNDDLLELYGLYKVATGEDILKADTPGIFDLKVRSIYIHTGQLRIFRLSQAT